MLRGNGGIIDNVSGEGQEKENRPDGAGLVDSPLFDVAVESATSPPSVIFSGISSASIHREKTLVFRREYPPSVRTVAEGTLQPVNLPFKLPGDLPPIAVVRIPVSVIVVPPPTFPVDVALNGIFLFFLFFKLKSSLPTLDVVDPLSSTSSSESSDDSYPPWTYTVAVAVLVVVVGGVVVGGYVCEKIWGGGRGSVIVEVVAEEEDEEEEEGILRFGRGRIARVVIKEGGRGEEFGGEGYCCWGGWL